MANITAELQAILAAVLGEEVRGSIYSAIYKINDASEKAIDSGTAINAGDPIGSNYEGALYVNTNTNLLLRANATNWVTVGRLKGNGIASITGPVTTGLDDEYTINYTEGPPTTFTVHNGRGVVSVTMTSQSGLIDTYTVLYNDGNYDTFSIKNGNSWYYGTVVSGMSSTPTGFTLPFEVKPGDSYLNISDDSIYHCTVGAPAGMTSTWVYDFTIASASTGTNNYNMLLNLPNINGVTITGAMTGHSLGLLDEADADAWLMDTTQTPPVPLVKPMLLNSTKITFSASEMLDINTNGWSCKPFFQCDDGQAVPALKKIIHNSDGTLDVTYTKVKAIQGTVTCKLRIIK